MIIEVAERGGPLDAVSVAANEGRSAIPRRLEDALDQRRLSRELGEFGADD